MARSPPPGQPVEPGKVALALDRTYPLADAAAAIRSCWKGASEASRDHRL